MGKIRVLVVDDSVVVRRLVSDVLSGDPEIEIAGIAANGKIGLAKIPQTNPDLVTLDIEMPEMDGLEAAREIRKLYPKLPIIMFSTLTQRGASATLDALAAGANDYVTKPANIGSVSASMARVREDLIPRIKGLCGRKGPALVIPAGGAVLPRIFPNRKSTIEVLTIGVSTGGPNALSEIIPALPADLPVPVLVVQHMPPVFTKHLADRLASKSKIRVKEAEDGDLVSSGTVYIAPGDYHMSLRKSAAAVHIALNQEPPENSCRPAVDPLFRAAVACYGSATLAVVLTGMGQDGFRGCQVVREAGGRVVVQDEATSVVWGMPGYVARANLAERVVPLANIASEITKIVGENRRALLAAV